MPGVAYQLRMPLERMNGDHPCIVRTNFELHFLFEHSNERLIPEIEGDVAGIWMKV